MVALRVLSAEQARVVLQNRMSVSQLSRLPDAASDILFHNHIYAIFCSLITVYSD